jgi:hypothetical protein
LMFFLDLLGPSYRSEDAIQAKIQADLERQFRINRGRGRIGGMRSGEHACRHRFVTLVEVAYIAESRLLAQALVGFLNRNQDRIWNERPEHIFEEWEPAISKLQDLLQSGYLEEEYPMWGRDYPQRRRHQDWGYRAISAPPVRRCRSLEMQLAIPRQAMIPYTPPMMSPALIVPEDPFDDVELLARGQEHIAQELQDVKYELRQLNGW